MALSSLRPAGSLSFAPTIILRLVSSSFTHHYRYEKAGGTVSEKRVEGVVMLMVVIKEEKKEEEKQNIPSITREIARALFMYPTTHRVKAPSVYETVGFQARGLSMKIDKEYINKPIQMASILGILYIYFFFPWHFFFFFFPLNFLWTTVYCRFYSRDFATISEHKLHGDAECNSKSPFSSFPYVWKLFFFFFFHGIYVFWIWNLIGDRYYLSLKKRLEN